jgi:glutathione peroxidase-family protein
MGDLIKWKLKKLIIEKNGEKVERNGKNVDKNKMV